MKEQKNIPELRFPEFKGEWEKKKLGEVMEFKAGYAFKSEKMLSEKSNYQILKMSNVYKNELRLDRNASYWENLNLKEKEFLLKDGDTILTLTGTVGKQDYGYSVQIKENNKYLLNQRLVLLREIENKSNNDFINHIISNEQFLFYFFGEAKGGTGNQTNVSTEDVKNIQLFFPSLPEQKRIASFFTVLDKKIDELKQKKNLLEQYKKGVMQKLFSQELRFKDENGKEFPKWEKKRLGEVLSIPEKIKPEKIEKNKLLTVKLHLKGLFKNESTDGLSIGSTNYFVRKKGQFIYGKQNLFNGAFGIVSDEFDGFLTSGDVPALDINFNKLNQTFLLGFLSRENFYKKLEDIASGSGSKRIHENTFLGVEIPIPSLKEQTKIANFLSGIDSKINRTENQIQQTQEYKKGLLQKMFC